MGEHKTKEIICKCCGIKIQSKPNTKYCPECSIIAMRIRKRIGARGHVTLSHEELIKAVKKELTTKTNDTTSDVQRCQYCGKTISVGKNNYCNMCRYEGFAFLHQATGRRKSTYRENKQKPPVQSGWRGQPVLGGATEIIRTISTCL